MQLIFKCCNILNSVEKANNSENSIKFALGEFSEYSVILLISLISDKSRLYPLFMPNYLNIHIIRTIQRQIVRILQLSSQT